MYGLHFRADDAMVQTEEEIIDHVVIGNAKGCNMMTTTQASSGSPWLHYYIIW